MAQLKTKKISRDIDLSFKINPYTKDIYLKTEEEAIKTSLKHLIKTQNFERKFHPEIGTQVFSLLFENKTAAVMLALERSIEDAINKFEPRVRIVDLNITEDYDSNDLEVTIVFTYKNIDQPITLTTLLSRVR